jgi:hypothetical protein
MFFILINSVQFALNIIMNTCYYASSSVVKLLQTKGCHFAKGQHPVWRYTILPFVQNWKQYQPRPQVTPTDLRLPSSLEFSNRLKNRKTMKYDRNILLRTFWLNPMTKTSYVACVWSSSSVYSLWLILHAIRGKWEKIIINSRLQIRLCFCISLVSELAVFVSELAKCSRTICVHALNKM